MYRMEAEKAPKHRDSLEASAMPGHLEKVTEGKESKGSKLNRNAPQAPLQMGEGFIGG